MWCVVTGGKGVAGGSGDGAALAATITTAEVVVPPLLL